MTDKRLRLAIVATHPIHYHTFRWSALADQPDIDLSVLYCKRSEDIDGFSQAFQREVEWDIPLLDGYPYRFFRNWLRTRTHGYWSVANPGLWAHLVRNKYDAVYFLGTHHFTHQVASVVARLRGARILYYSVCYDLDRRTRLKALVRNITYRLVYKFADRILYIGKHTLDHYRNAGVDDRKLVFVPHIVDNDRFRSQRNRMTVIEAKERLGIPLKKKVVLFCAKMFDKKQPQLLLDAFAEANLDGWVLLMVGNGTQRQQLMESAERRIPGRVVFPGFLNQTEIGLAYCAADVHVLPSKYTETWGLVVNESLNFGCAQIVSDMVGCAPNLVAGKTGEVFPSRDKAALVNILETLNSDPEKWRRYQAEAPRVLETHNIDAFVAGVREALDLPPQRSRRIGAPSARLMVRSRSHARHPAHEQPQA